MLQQITPQLWIAQQPQKFFGLEVGTKMSVIALGNGELVLISPIKLDNAIAEINALGRVKYIIAPNLFHHLYLEECHKIYPDALTVTPPGLQEKIGIQSSLVFTEDEIDFNGELEYFLFAGFAVPLPTGIKEVNEVVFFHRASKTLIVTDLAFYFDDSFPVVTQFASRVLGCYQKLRPSILEKLVIKDKEAVANSINRLLQWDFQRVVVAHGTIVEENAKQQLKEGYEWFLTRQL